MIDILAWGVLGAIIGSFLNVVILRRGVRGLGGRSACPSCNTTLKTADLIPILSWVLLRGRCRYCGTRISIQYPLVEFITAVAFVMVGMAPIELVFKLLSFPVVALLIAIAVYDLRTTIIPDSWVLALGMLTSVIAVLGAHNTHGEYVLTLAAGLFAALPLIALWAASRVRGLPFGAWMGFGDPKLALSIGWLLGFPGGVNAVLLAFIIGAVVSVPLLVLSSDIAPKIIQFIPIASFQKKRLSFTMKSEVPFGPFLVASCFIVWFSQLYSVPLPFVWQ